MPKVALARYKEAYFMRQRSWPDLNAQDRPSLLCLDNIPAAIGLPPQLYPQAPNRLVARRDQFEHLVDQMIKARPDQLCAERSVGAELAVGAAASVAVHVVGAVEQLYPIKSPKSAARRLK